MSNNPSLRIGIDLGGTKIEIALLNATGEYIFRDRVATPQGDYNAIVQCVVVLVEAVELKFVDNAVKLPVGIATPGILYDAKIKNSNSTCLNGKTLLADIESALQRPVRMSNDANCFALSEAIDGAAQGAKVVFGVIIGTGTGAGLVIEQKVLTGCNGIAGEWGHNALPWPSDEDAPAYPCYCGKQGGKQGAREACIETYLSGPGFSRRYNEVAKSNFSAKEIVQLAQDGTKLAQQHLSDYQQRLAKSLASVINILDPDVIVLGGGMSNIESLYQTVPRLWLDYVFSDSVQTKLLPPKFGDSSGVRGAAWLWPCH